MDAELFIAQFQDYMAPTLDVYEQAIYLYLIRKSRLLKTDDVVVAFKSARQKLAFGIGVKGSPPSEGTCYEKVRSLEKKGYIKVLASENTGTRISPFLPNEIPGLIVATVPPLAETIEDMDFFEVSENRELILQREKFRCFYCQAILNSNNYVIEHIVSRPQGNNSYRNVVSACRQCNNRKGSADARDYLRTLYREGFLSQNEFEGRLSHLELVQSGDLKPEI